MVAPPSARYRDVGEEIPADVAALGDYNNADRALMVGGPLTAVVAAHYLHTPAQRPFARGLWLWTSLCGFGIMNMMRANARVETELSRRGIRPQMTSLRHQGLKGSAKRRAAELAAPAR